MLYFSEYPLKEQKKKKLTGSWNNTNYKAQRMQETKKRSKEQMRQRKTKSKIEYINQNITLIKDNELNPSK